MEEKLLFHSREISSSNSFLNSVNLIEQHDLELILTLVEGNILVFNLICWQ